MFQGYFMVFWCCYLGAATLCYQYFRDVLGELQEYFEDVFVGGSEFFRHHLGDFQGCFKASLGLFLG